jgi:hypothetical protein
MPLLVCVSYAIFYIARCICKSIARKRPQDTHGQQYRSSVFFMSVRMLHIYQPRPLRCAIYRISQQFITVSAVSCNFSSEPGLRVTQISERTDSAPLSSSQLRHCPLIDSSVLRLLSSWIILWSGSCWNYCRLAFSVRSAYMGTVIRSFVVARMHMFVHSGI